MKHIFSLVGVLFILVFILLTIPLGAAAQKDTTGRLLMPYYKNVIKFNPTPMILWSSKNVTLGYERILGPRQSIALSVGFLEMPSLFSNDTIGRVVAITSREKGGINATLEYRFYLSKRNRRPIPDGLYLAPYATYYGYKFKNNLDVVGTSIDSSAVAVGKFYCFNLGLELGYQFVFWKRLTLDLVLFGPSVSYYGGELDITGEIDLTKIRDVNEEVYDRIMEKYPLASTFLVDKSFKNNGTLDLLAVGFRYVVQIGFHF